MFAHHELSGFGALAAAPVDPGAYHASAVVFDGTNDYLTRGSDWTGAADGKTGLVSFWIRKMGGDGATKVVYNDQALGEIQFTTGNKLRMDFYTSAVAQVFRYATSTSVTSPSAWLHILASWDAAASVFQMYLNDASDVATEVGITNATIDYTRTNHTFGARDASSSNIMNMEIADFYFNQGAYLDLSNSANRRKFISATGKPVYLGANGEVPTGAAPIVFLSGPAANFATNKGTGGGMTTTGTLTDAATSPSD